ncbi:MAG: hypothetical protein J5586_05270 [Clostridia bacterium]|nr:hypothetical protein [Clostridia bacterium]
MKRYTDPEMEVVSFDIEDVTNGDVRFGDGDNEGSGGGDFWGDSINW